MFWSPCLSHEARKRERRRRQQKFEGAARMLMPGCPTTSLFTPLACCSPRFVCDLGFFFFMPYGDIWKVSVVWMRMWLGLDCPTTTLLVSLLSVARLAGPWFSEGKNKTKTCSYTQALLFQLFYRWQRQSMIDCPGIQD